MLKIFKTFILGLVLFLGSYSPVFAAPVTQTFQVNQGVDDVNEAGTNYYPSDPTVWLGTGGSATASFSGFRFNNVSVPKNASITSARLEFRSPQAQWLTIGYQLKAENVGNSALFTTTSKPSQRALTTAVVNHSSDTQWLTNTWYQSDSLNAVVQEVVNRSDWNSGNSLSFVLKGTVGTWGRKFATSFENNPTLATRLVITYDSAGGGPTPTAAPTPTTGPTATPTSTPGGNQALNFSTSSDSTANAGVYPGSAGTQTFEAWVKPATNNAYGMVMHNRSDDDASGWLLELRNGQAELWIHDNSGADRNLLFTGVTMTGGTWHHIAATYNSATHLAQVFVDGTPSSQLDMGVLSQGPNFRMGTFGGGGFVVYHSCSCMIDEVRVSNNIRYTGSFTPPTNSFSSDTNTLLLYHFNEGSGQTSTDSSTNNNTLTLGTSTSVESIDPSWIASDAPIGGPLPTPTSTPTPTPTTIPTPTPTSVPASFQNQTQIVGLTQPTTLQFLPGGKMLILERMGTIKIVPAGGNQVSSTAFMTLTNINTDQGERGLVGITLDPNFATNNYFYIFYTANSPLRDRVSRFTASGDTASLATEQVIWEDNVASTFWHHGGTVAFGLDGKLYISQGDGFDTAAGNLHVSQRLDSYHGKILRVSSDGTIPTDNPFYDGAGPNLDAIWARGLRNPFRFAFDSTSGTMYIGDVGGNNPDASIEEVDKGVAGANYGWPICEGTCSTSGMTNPIHSYNHNNRDASVTAGFVYHGTQFPSQYLNSFFYGDYAQNWIKRLTFNPDGSVNQNLNFEPSNGAMDTPIGDIVDIKQGPEGALYYVDVALDINGIQTGFGTVHKISYFSGNQPPVIASASGTPTSGVAPLNVSFSATATDPDNDPLTFSWNFGDGGNGTGANLAHNYTSAGAYTVRVTVSDGPHQTISNPITITVGQPPLVTIDAPINNTSFRAGEVISYSATGSDPNGTLTDASYSWTVVFHHEGHVHPGAGPTSGPTGTFTIPTQGHDFSGNTSFEFIVAVTDSENLTTTKSVTIYPDKVNLNIQTVPTGLRISIDGVPQTTPFVKDTLIGFQHSLSVEDQQVLAGKTYQFSSWSDLGAATHTIVVPTTNSSYTATYQEVTSDISGQVYVDTNRNGVKDGAEVGYQGATINLTGAGTANTTSDSGGNYSFADRSLGNYSVNLTAPSGYDITTTNPVAVTLGTDAIVNFGVAIRVDPVTVTYQVSAGVNDVNEVNSVLDATSITAWLGNGGTTTTSFTGLRFTGVNVPRNATIQSAKLEVNSSTAQWQNISFLISADLSGNSPVFSTTSRPSQRSLSTANVAHSSDVNWTVNTWYQLNEMAPVVQEIVNRSDWNSGNSLSIITKGTGGAFGRKFIKSFEGTPASAPRLIITYK